MTDNYSIIFTAQQKAELLKAPFLEKPTPEEIIGKTIVSVISSGSESGGFMNYFGGNTYPCETGYAGVLKVIEIGENVKSVSKGDLVFAQTPHKLLNRIPAENVIGIRRDILPEKAVLCRFPAVSMTTMINTAIKPTEAVLVSGLGIIGLMCAQMMQHCGYEVYAIDPVEKRRDVANKCGIRNVFASVGEMTLSPKCAGLAIDCSGNEKSVFALLPYIRQGGELSLVGVPWRRTSEAYAYDLLKEIFCSYIHIYSGWEWSIPLHSGRFNPNSNFRSFETALNWIADDVIHTDGIYKLVEPEDCGTIYPAIASGTFDSTCAIFDWRKFQ
jgi:Zn-dependent alcohol dehydrogenases